MTKIYFFIAVLLLALLISSSCKKSNASPNFTDFPATDGTRWKYLVYDSIHGFLDTQTVIVTGPAMLQDGRAVKVIKSFYSSSLDTTYKFLFEDAVHAIFYVNNEGKDYDKLYTYPLEVGASWNGENILDTNKVKSNANITVPAGNFQTYLIERNYKVPNNAIRESEWYTPGIGMVQRSYYEINLGYIINKHFSLFSYSIAQ